MKNLVLILFSIIFLVSCGTLGGFEIITFPVSKNKVNSAIDSLYKNFPEYKIPEKWKELNDWQDRGYGFLDSRIFYFKSTPEEMYYVSFIDMEDDSTKQDVQLQTSLSIRAVSKGEKKWWLHKELNAKEQKRIENRFKKEIISKLKVYLKIP